MARWTRRWWRAALLGIVVALLAAAPAIAETWTIGGPVSNDTGSAADSCPPESPPGWAGCVWIQHWASDGLSLQNGSTEGNIPAGVPAGASSPLLFFAEERDEGADWWGSTVAPDGSPWTLSIRDDVAERSGRYAGCAESAVAPQPPQFVCTPSWSGEDAAPTTGFQFSPSASAPVASAGQFCATSSASDSDRVDCATSASEGNISPVPVSGDVMANVEIIDVGPFAADISIGDSGYGNGWCEVTPEPGSNTCDLSTNVTSGDIEIWPAGGAANVPIGIEVTGVSYGLYALDPPTVLPTGDLVPGTLSPGRVLRAGEAVKAGPCRVVMRADGELSEYLSQGGGAYRVFTSGTSVPGSRAVVAPDESIAVKSPGGRTLWSSRRATTSRSMGNLVVYSRRHRRLWLKAGPVSGAFATRAKTGTVALSAGRGIPAGGELAAGRHRLTMRSDGELVLTDRGQVRWRSRTRGHPGAYLLVRPDGNAVVDSLRHRVLWSSGTGGHRGAALQLRAADGRLGIVDRHGDAIWSRR